MARDFKRQNKLAVISDLNVTPLIDLAFSLLIIFMITTPVIEQYNRIDLPSQKTSKPQKPPELSDQFITIDHIGIMVEIMMIFEGFSAHAKFSQRVMCIGQVR